MNLQKQIIVGEPLLEKASRLVGRCKADTRQSKRTTQATLNSGRKYFDPKNFLANIGDGCCVETFPKGQIIFAQGDRADSIFYIQKGSIQLTVVSDIGKEATLGILIEGQFFGESILLGQRLRRGSAIAFLVCELARIDEKAMMLALHQEPEFLDLFVGYLLTRNVRCEEDLLNQIFNYSEERLARILLSFAKFGKDEMVATVTPRISQETLAEMVGTTRGRVNFFMNKFRRLGFVEYGTSGLKVHNSLLNALLTD